LHCGKCGAEIPDGAKQCASCGEPVAQPRPFDVSPATEAAAVRPRIRFAGFWLRLLAFVIDSLTVLLLMSPILWDLVVRNLGPDVTPERFQAFIGGGTTQRLALQMLFELVRALYFAVFESSAWQATPAKKMLGLYVTDLGGRRLTFGRAAARSFAKIISEFTLLVGFLMAGFTQRKQALHDVITGCLVLRKTSS
jgi:uncharacterized RDD family membrane protein YckC